MGIGGIIKFKGIKLKRIIGISSVISMLLLAFLNLSTLPPQIIGYGLGGTNREGLWINTSNAPCPVVVNFYDSQWKDLGNVVPSNCQTGHVVAIIPTNILNYNQSIKFNIQLKNKPTLWSKASTLNIRPILYSKDSLGIGYNLPDLAMNYIDISSTSTLGELRKKIGRRSIRSAYRSGAQHVAVFLPGFVPQNAADVAAGRNNLALWQTNPTLYWQRIDEMMNNVSSYGLGIVVRGWNDLRMFPALTGETTKDLLTNPNSKSFLLYSKYWTQFATRYKNRPELLALGAPNEMNSGADIDMKKMCLDGPYGSAANCANVSNYTTADMNKFSQNLTAMFRKAAPNKKIASGMALQRPSAFHLIKSPQWIAADWTPDSMAEFDSYFNAMQAPYDYADVHFYNDGNNVQRWGYGNGYPESIGILPHLVDLATRSGKQLYIGEFADLVSMQTQPFTMNVINEMGIPGFSSASIWALDYYQRNSYEMQVVAGSSLPLDGANPAMKPLYAAVKSKRDALNNKSILANSYTLPYEQPHTLISYPLDGTKVSTSVLVNVLGDGGSTDVQKVILNLGGKNIRTLTAWPFKTTLYRSESTAGTHVLTATVYSKNGMVKSHKINVVFD